MITFSVSSIFAPPKKTKRLSFFPISSGLSMTFIIKACLWLQLTVQISCCIHAILKWWTACDILQNVGIDKGDIPDLTKVSRRHLNFHIISYITFTVMRFYICDNIWFCILIAISLNKFISHMRFLSRCTSQNYGRFISIHVAVLCLSRRPALQLWGVSC